MLVTISATEQINLAQCHELFEMGKIVGLTAP